MFSDPPRPRRGRRHAAWMAALMVVATAFVPGSAAAASDSQGTEFWLTFPGNLESFPELTLFIAGSTATMGTVEIPGLAFSSPFSVTPGTVTSVSLPPDAQISTSDTVENLGIHVTAAAEVSVYGLNRIQFTTDAYMGLPVDILGTSYVALGFQNTDIANGTELAVVATTNGTTVTITPTVTTDGHVAGVAYTVALDAGQTYQLRNTDASPADLSGTIVTSDKPVALFGGHICANIPDGNTFFCDHVVEQLPPVTTWGKSFVTMPLATRVGGDTFRIVASDAATEVRVNGSVVATLGAGQVHQQLIDGPATITSDKPVLVAQYSNGTTFDNVTSDPFMMLIPPYEQFLASYTVTTPASGFNTNFINLVVPDAAVGSVVVDGVPIPAASYVVIGSSGFRGTQQAVGLGSHTLSGPLPFGAFMYGFADFDSYGYPGGQSLAPIVLVTSIALTPATATNPVNTQHCVDATVADQNDGPVAGVRVDFSVTGSNPGSGFANTNASGVAPFCYTGTMAGSDTITASVGTLSDTATKTWTPDNVNPPPTSNAGADKGGTEGSAISLDGTVTNEPGTDTVSQTWSYALGGGTDAGMTCAFANASAVDTTITCTDDGAVSVKLTVSDGINPPVEDTAVLTIANADPAVSITSPSDGSTVNVGATVNVTAAWGDAGSNDSHTCSIDWGDGTITTGALTATTCSGGHAYASIGAPAVGVTITDDDGGSAFDEILLVVAEGGTKVTGGGWIARADGKLRFGLVADPAGGTAEGEIQVRWGTHRFHGTTVSGLTASRPSASWSGVGRYDGSDGYSYEVTVVDNGSGGGRSRTPDTFAIVIRDGGGTIVFNASGPLGGGNIKIH